MRWKKPSLLDHESLFPLMERQAVIPCSIQSRTSRKAAKDVEPRFGTQLHQAWMHIRSCGKAGCCDFEAIRDLAHLWPTIANGWRSKRDILAKKMLIVLANITRISPSGSECDVWIAREHV